MYESSNISDSLEDSKKLSHWLADQLQGLKIPNLPGSKRLQLALACQHLAFEHGQAAIVLAEQGLYGSALALQRPMVEGIVRGMWLRYTAKDDEEAMAVVQQGKFPHFDQMIQGSLSSIDQNDRTPLDVLRKIWWKRLCGYTHGGSEQIYARLGPSGLCAYYPDDEIMHLLRSSNMIRLYASVEMASGAGNKALVKAFLQRMGSPTEGDYEL